MIVATLAAWFPLHIVRTATVRALGGRLAQGVTLYHGFQIRNPRGLVIGARTSVGDGTILDARGGLTIGSDVNISTRVQIWTAQHDWRAPGFDYIDSAVTIGDHVWIGPGVIVLPGASIGPGAVIGAGAVVAGTIPPNVLAVGVPAQAKGERPTRMAYKLPSSRRKSWFW